MHSAHSICLIVPTITWDNSRAVLVLTNDDFDVSVNKVDIKGMLHLMNNYVVDH